MSIEEPVPQYEVDSYQIAVPNGDCSAHFLVDRNASTATTLGDICRSILVDGGNDAAQHSNRAANIIKHSLALLSIRYTVDGAPITDIKFDAWIVTHWDSDHWAGALNMMQQSLRDGEVPCKYFKYDGAKPLTTLYCPNWVWVPRFQMDGRTLFMQERPNIKRKPEWLDVENLSEAELEGGGVVSIKLPQEGPVAERIIPGFCIARWGHRQLLGVDFFTGERSWNRVTIKSDPRIEYDWDMANTVPSFDVLKNRKPSHLPKFLRVGVGGFLIGKKIDDKELEKALGKVNSQVDGTWFNRSSIISCLYFPNTSNISLYWAGDAVSEIESALVKLNIQGQYFFSGHKVKVAKWSHHGSKGSSPLELWSRFRVQKSVVSSNGTGNYAHPRMY
jgi:hypothetical protein